MKGRLNNVIAHARRRLLFAAALVVGLSALLPVAPLSAAKFNKVLDIGKPGPAWKELLGVDGKRHSLDDLKDAKLVVVVFACNHCPVVKAYERRLIRFVDDYRDKGIEFVAISVSRQPSDQLPQMKTRASDSGFNFAYLIDPSQKIARDYGATCTPHVFVLDQQRRVAYMGKIDDHLDESKVDERFLREAVDALLAGKKPEVAETRQVGCEIEFAE